jgi:hypothetical protein
MRVGLDLDNTIACYDRAFHAAGREQGLLPTEGVRGGKSGVRDWLHAQGRQRDFTRLQGYVYGPGMRHTELYPGVLAALRELRAAGCELWVVSHRTKVPFEGPAYDLHAEARNFLRARGLVGEGAPLAEEHVFLEETKDAKVARACALGCDVFVDDLPEILAMGFPAHTRRILFDPLGDHAGSAYERVAGWPDLAQALLAS